MTDRGFVLALTSVDDEHPLLPEEIDALTRELRRLLSEEDDIEVTAVPAEAEPGTRASAVTLISELFIAVYVGHNIRKIVKDVRKSTERMKETSTDIKESAHNVRAVADDLLEALAIVAPRIAGRVRHFQELHPEVRTAVVAKQREPQDITGQSADNIEKAIVASVEGADRSTPN